MDALSLCRCQPDGSVNQGDEGLGQPRQVMTAGTHGPSRQLIFELETCVHAKWHHLEVVQSWHSSCPEWPE